MILGDMQGGDKHSGTTINYSKTLKRLCRQCNVRGDQAGNPYVKCHKMSMLKIRDYQIQGRTDLLERICQQNVYVAWFDVCFGGDPCGIFSAAMPVEALHSLEAGLIKDSLEILFTEDLKPRGCHMLDCLVKKMTTWERQHFLSAGTNKEMPRLLFKDGATKLTQISHTHIVGMMLTILIISLTDEGKTILLHSFKTNGHLHPDRRLKNMQNVFSMLLAYWSWLKKPTYWIRGDIQSEKKAEDAIRTMLNTLVTQWPRTKGNGWEKAKFHEQLHVPRDISRNGSPRESYGGPLEHNHIPMKDLSKRTQRRRDVHDSQLATRIAESYIINTAHSAMTKTKNLSKTDPVDTPNPCRIPRGSASGILTLTRGSGRNLNQSFSWKTKRLGGKNEKISFSEKQYSAL